MLRRVEKKQAPGTIAIDGQAIRKARQARFMSQRELAQLAELRPETVNQLERGLRDHTYPKTLRKLAKALDVAPADLVRSRALLKDKRVMAGAVVDVTDALPACAICGAAGYFHAFPDGMMVVCWRCGHTADDQEFWLHEDKIHAGLYPGDEEDGDG